MPSRQAGGERRQRVLLYFLLAAALAPATPLHAQAEFMGDELPTLRQREAIAALVGDAVRLARDGQAAAADAALVRAEAVAPGAPEVADARRVVAEVEGPRYQLALQLARARLAIARDDSGAAETALAAAARLDPGAAEIARLRQRLDASQRAERARDGRLAGLLSDMRGAIARHDLAAADRALNAAERLDVRDPVLDTARGELAAALAAATGLPP